MAKPEEFTIHIEPDGRIVLEGVNLEDASWRRIVELLEETVGPVQHEDVAAEDPPTRHWRPTTGQAGHLECEKK